MCIIGERYLFSSFYFKNNQKRRNFPVNLDGFFDECHVYLKQMIREYVFFVKNPFVGEQIELRQGLKTGDILPCSLTRKDAEKCTKKT